MMFNIYWNDNGHLELTGRFDASEVEHAEAEFGKIDTSTVIDMSELEYISSAGLGLLVTTYRRLVVDGNHLSLINMNSHIRNVLVLTGLDKLFNI